MTPLLGTKPPSAPVGDKSGGDRRAARSLLSCALWRGMGRPEPLSAHRPHQQQGLSGFHGSRDTNHAIWFFPVPPATSRRATPSPANGFSRITRHETRIMAFTAVRFDVGANGSHNQQPLPGPPHLSRNHCFPVHFCSLLFAIVRYCSLLFTNKYCPEPVFTQRPSFSVDLTSSAVGWGIP